MAIFSKILTDELTEEWTEADNILHQGELHMIKINTYFASPAGILLQRAPLELEQVLAKIGSKRKSFPAFTSFNRSRTWK